METTTETPLRELRSGDYVNDGSGDNPNARLLCASVSY